MRKKVSSNQPPTYVTDDCYFSDAVQDVKPDSNVLSSVGDWSSHFTHKLVGVDSDLEDVVGEREKWSQWECSHKDGDETELENCEEQFNMTTLSTIIRNLKVIDKYTPNKMKTAVGLGLKEHPIHTINSSLLSYAFGPD